MWARCAARRVNEDDLTWQSHRTPLVMLTHALEARRDRRPAQPIQCSLRTVSADTVPHRREYTQAV